MLLNTIFLMAPQGAGGQQQSPWSGITMMVLIIAVFYFFFIRPQQKKNKEIRKFRESMKKGDKVVTIGGIHGKILEMNDKTVVIETEGQGRLRVNKEAITKDGMGQPMGQ